MRRKRNLEKLICLLLVSLLVWSSGFFGSSAHALSIDEETMVGSKFLDSVRRQFTFIEDDFVNEYIHDLGQYLVKSLDTEPFPFRFYVVASNDINAFAGPGGHIFLFTGLITVMDRADELASVICHEIGHVSGRHISTRIEQNKKIAWATLAGILAGALIGGKAAGAVMTGSMAAGVQQQLNYSREDERQADQMGFKCMDLCGFDPSGMVDTLKKLERGHWQGANAVPSYLLTHPGGSERISNTEAMMSDYKPREESSEIAKFRKLFPWLKMTLIAKSPDSKDAEKVIGSYAKEEPDSAIANYGYGLMWKERADYTKAMEYLRKALNKEPTFVPILRNLGEAYQLKGQDEEAIYFFEKALKVNDQDKAALFLMGSSYQNLENYGKAVVFYERLASMKPVKDEVYRRLGVCYGRQGRLALAHYHFGIYFMGLGELDKAKFHFQKADEAAANDPALKNRIREGTETLRAKEKKSSF